MTDSSSHWKRCKLGDVIHLKNGYAFKSQDYAEDGVPLVRISDINDEKVSIESSVRIPKEKINPGFYVEQGDLLIAMSGATTGKTGVYNGTVPVLQNQRVGNFKIINEAVVDKKWRNYYVASLRKEIEQAAYGGAQPNISSKGIEAFDFPLASLDEQKLIVAEIEKQFSRLDEAVANLKRIKANLKRYKAAVLKAAVEGKLTEAWRKTHPDVEPATKLLARILTERRTNWIGKGKYKEPGKPDVSNLSELPQHWVWCLTDALFSFVTSGSRGWAQYYSDDGPLFLRMGNLDHESIRLDLGDVQRVKPPAGTEGMRTKVETGDILISITADVGMISLVPASLGDAYINQHVSLARPLNGFCREYLAWYLASQDGGQKMFLQLQRGATKVGLGLDDIRAVPVPFPPLAEQQEILAEIERRLSVIDELEATVKANLTRANRLRQSVLSLAFRGEL